MPPRELLDESEVVKKYFDRWPLQEKIFREEKSSVEIHRVSGHGIKMESYDKMVERHRQICETITHLKFKLKAPLIEINAIETQLIDLYQQEKMLREKSMIVEGIRILDDPDAICLIECESQINRCIRQKAKIEKEHKDDFDKLKKNVEEEKRIRNKDKVIKCFEGEKFELLTLMESIFQLDGSASVSDDRKVIDLEMNPKEPDLMDKIYKGLQILNTMQVHDLEGRVMGFKT